MTGKRRARTAQQIMWDDTSEAALQAAIVEALLLHGWMVDVVKRSAYRSEDGTKRSAVLTPGRPDIVAVHKDSGRIVAWELKTMKGKVTPEQATWLDAWEKAGAFTRIVRPANHEDVLKWLAQ